MVEAGSSDFKCEALSRSSSPDDEKQEVMKDRDIEWLKSLCLILANTIKEIGDQFDICAGGDE